MGERISLRAYAAHRDCALRAVQKAIESERLLEPAYGRDAEGRLAWIDAELADKQWSANTDPEAAAKAGKVLDDVDELEHGENGAESSAPAAPSSSSEYQRARANREHYQAEQAKLDYLRNIGQLVSAEEVREVTYKRYRAIRDKFLNIPDRVATILAAERDPARVHAALTDEIKRVLSELTTDAGAESAGGPRERVAA